LSGCAQDKPRDGGVHAPDAGLGAHERPDNDAAFVIDPEGYRIEAGINSPA